MPGPRYCILCGEAFQGGRVDRRYCGANCRTRACRMRQRGEPIHEKSAPQPVSLAALLNEGLPCPCCGVRIVMHVTTTQAGVPDGHTTAVIPRGPTSAEHRSHQGASRPAARKRSQGTSQPHQRAQAVARAPAAVASSVRPPEKEHTLAHQLTESLEPPDAKRTTQAGAIGPRVARQPSSTPAAPQRRDAPHSPMSDPVPSEIFNQKDLWLPCYKQIGERPAVYISAAAKVK